MNMLRIVRYSLWSLVIAIVIGVSAVAFGLLPQNGDNDQSAGDVGGPFALTAMDGSAFSTDQIEGSPRAIFFGFTYCPDVCPTSLYEVSTWLDDLGKDGDQLKAYFITVDPERDTPDVLSNYLSAFGDRITGLTGTPDQIAEVARDYRVYFQRVDLDDGDYTMDHTASVFLFRGDGSFFGTIAYGEAKDQALEKLRRLARS